MPTYKELFDKFAFSAFEKRSRLMSLIGEGEYEWHLDTLEATISFNEDLKFPVQFLGTESEASNTWLWADANEDAPFPEHSLDQCRKVRRIGREFGLAEFDLDKFEFVNDFGKVNGDSLAAVSTCLAQASCYYRSEHDQGAVFLTIDDPKVDAQPDLDRYGLREAFNEISWASGDLKTQILSYLKEKGYIGDDAVGEHVQCRLHTGEEVAFHFTVTPEGYTEYKMDG